MRRIDRVVTDDLQIRDIIERAKIVHVGMIDDERPYVVPMQYGATFAGGQLTLYLHCAQEGRKVDILKKNPRVFIELETDIALISGGEVPCKYGSAYASVMGDGTAVFVEDIKEKIFGLRMLMKTQTGRDFEITAQQAAGVAVFRFDAESYSVKERKKR